MSSRAAKPETLNHVTRLDFRSNLSRPARDMPERLHLSVSLQVSLPVESSRANGRLCDVKEFLLCPPGDTQHLVDGRLRKAYARPLDH